MVRTYLKCKHETLASNCVLLSMWGLSDIEQHLNKVRAQVGP